MVQAIGAIGNNFNRVDPEYTRILMELYKLNVKPSGDKEIDKAKLEEEKHKLAEKIQQKFDVETPEKNNNSDKAKLEEQRLGAMTVGELNKVLHGLV